MWEIDQLAKLSVELGVKIFSYNFIEDFGRGKSFKKTKSVQKIMNFFHMDVMLLKSIKILHKWLKKIVMIEAKVIVELEDHLLRLVQRWILDLVFSTNELSYRRCTIKVRI